MRKILLWIMIFITLTISVYSATFDEAEEKATIQQNQNIIIPDEITWTDRFILTELKELRIWLEWIKREIYSEIQNRELETVDKALSYSANTVNFFFVFITIIVMWFWVVGWRTVGDIKKSTMESMDRKTKKIIENFENQISELEREQKINIFWRQFNTVESDQDKMNILDKIHAVKPDSQYVTIERGNVYLSMWLYDKVLEVTESIISSERTKHQPHAFYNRACAYNGLGNKEKVISEIAYLLQLAPEYKDIILDSEYLESMLSNPSIKKLLN